MQVAKRILIIQRRQRVKNVYYSGDYVPFVSEGEVTEVRTYDSDYAPMD